MEQIGVETDDLAKVRVVKQKMEILGIKCDDFAIPGRYHQLFCPKVSPLLYSSVNMLLHIYIILLATLYVPLLYITFGSPFIVFATLVFNKSIKCF